MPHLNLNIDHFATLRNARGDNEPNLVYAAKIAETTGASGIVMHLRKDRRHIRDEDVIIMKSALNTYLNLEMSMDKEIVQFACDIRPAVATIVPEELNELTTEGGLDVLRHQAALFEVCKKLQDEGIIVSLFIEPNEVFVEIAKEIGADRVEFNTKDYALAYRTNDWEKIGQELFSIDNACDQANELGIYIAAGHSLNYHNIEKIAANESIEEYNIGHAIVSRALIVGLEKAVIDMIDLINIYE